MENYEVVHVNSYLPQRPCLQIHWGFFLSKCFEFYTTPARNKCLVFKPYLYFLQWFPKPTACSILSWSSSCLRFMEIIFGIVQVKDLPASSSQSQPQTCEDLQRTIHDCPTDYALSHFVLIKLSYNSQSWSEVQRFTLLETQLRNETSLGMTHSLRGASICVNLQGLKSSALNWNRTNIMLQMISSHHNLLCSLLVASGILKIARSFS